MKTGCKNNLFLTNSKRLLATTELDFLIDNNMGNIINNLPNFLELLETNQNAVSLYTV